MKESSDRAITIKELRGGDRETFYRKVEAMPSTWWSSVTEHSDIKVYKRYDNEVTLVVYFDDRFCGMADLEPERRTIVDYLAVSYGNLSESLRRLLNGVVAYARIRGIEEIMIPVDSTKKVFLRTLMSEGFRIVETEYRLSKKLYKS